MEGCMFEYMLRIRKIMKETRDIRCCMCRRPGTTTHDAQRGWIFTEPGWASLTGSHLCPICNAELKARVNKENQLHHEKWLKSVKGE